MNYDIDSETSAQQAFQQRAKACTGAQLHKKYTTKGETHLQETCALCKTKTPYICIGCKCHVCNKNRDTKYCKLINEHAFLVEFLKLLYSLCLSIYPYLASFIILIKH